MSVIEVIDQVCEDICHNYCKKPDEWKREHNLETMNDAQYQEFMDEVCENCPLFELH